MSERYLHVVSHGPLLIVRVPDDPAPRWRLIMRELTQVMRHHGQRQKDISTIEVLWCRGSDSTGDVELLDKLRAAFLGDASKFRRFWLYDWQHGVFVKAREGTT